MNKVGSALREYFKTQCITQVQVAERIGASQPYVARIFRGATNIGSNTARKLVDAYGFSYTFLLTGEGELFDSKIEIENKIIEATSMDVERDEDPHSAEYWKAKYEAAQEEIDRLNELVRIALGGAVSPKAIVG